MKKSISLLCLTFHTACWELDIADVQPLKSASTTQFIYVVFKYRDKSEKC